MRMRNVVDIGRRIELVPMDPHFNDISIGLYRQQANHRGDTPVFLVHTYSHISGAVERIASVVAAMQVLGGMLKNDDGLLRFPCNSAHEAACRRVFLEACKLAPDTPAEPRPLNILDKKSQLTVTVDSTGKGAYRVTAEGEGKSAARRISAIAGGLAKLGEMETVETDNRDTVTFPCTQSHDALVGLLLTRAPNVRVVLRQEEMGAARGVLSAPSQQT